MKNLIILFCLFISMQVVAQSFEGTVTWSVTEGDKTMNLLQKVKEGTVITVLQGGPMNGVEMWSSDNNNKVMRIMRTEKMFVIVPPQATQSADNTVVYGPFTKTTETATVAGYACIKYTGEVTERGKILKVSIWTTTQLKDDSKSLIRQPSPFSSTKLPTDVIGIPLRIEKQAASGTTVMEVKEVKAAKFSEEDFKIPVGFTEMGK